MDNREYSYETFEEGEADFWVEIMESLVAQGKAVKFITGGGYREKRKGGWADSWSGSLVEYAHQNHEKTREFLRNKGVGTYKKLKDRQSAFLNEFIETEWRNPDNPAIETITAEEEYSARKAGNEEIEFSMLVLQQKPGLDSVSRDIKRTELIERRISKRVVLGRDARGRFTGNNQSVTVDAVAIRIEPQKDTERKIRVYDYDKKGTKKPKGALIRIETSAGRYQYVVISDKKGKFRGQSKSDRNYEEIAKKKQEYNIQLYDHRTGKERKLEIIARDRSLVEIANRIVEEISKARR